MRDVSICDGAPVVDKLGGGASMTSAFLFKKIIQSGEASVMIVLVMEAQSSSFSVHSHLSNYSKPSSYNLQ